MIHLPLPLSANPTDVCPQNQTFYFYDTKEIIYKLLKYILSATYFYIFPKILGERQMKNKAW